MRFVARKNRGMTNRLHGVLLVAQGMTCPEVARLLGDAPRSVEYWVLGFERSGLAGLREGERSGRPSRLNEKQLKEINSALRQMPRDMGLGRNLWDGKTLAVWIAQRYKIDLGVRQCQLGVDPAVETLENRDSCGWLLKAVQQQG
jgi:transposase